MATKGLVLLLLSSLAQTNANSGGEVAFGETLSDIYETGYLRCGVHYDDPLFGQLSSLVRDSPVIGFAADFCRAIARAIFPDVEEIEDVIEFFEANPGSVRYEELDGLHYDVLIREAVPTLGHDVPEGLEFSRPIFYDGQGFMINDKLLHGINKLPVETMYNLDYEDTTICYVVDFDIYEAQEMLLDALFVEIASYEDAIEQLLTGSCKALVGVKSVLAGLLSGDYKILPGTLDRFPQTIGTKETDEEWTQIVRWVLNGLVLADYYDLNKVSLSTLKVDTLAMEAQQLLTVSGGLPLVDNFMYNVILEVGSYRDIYSRYLEGSIPREGTWNALWVDGGLQFAEAWSSSSHTDCFEITVNTTVCPENDIDAPTPPACEAVEELKLNCSGVITDIKGAPSKDKKGVTTTYDDIRDYDKLRCGVPFDSPLFGIASTSGEDVAGFDADMCRAVARAVFPHEDELWEQIEFIEATSSNRFDLLLTGQIDVLFRQTTSTMQRDVEMSLAFTAPLFYDGQGFLVRATSSVRVLSDIEIPSKDFVDTEGDTSICAVFGTTSYLFIETTQTYAGRLKGYADYVGAMADLNTGACMAVTGDKTRLITYSNRNFRLLNDMVSREPLAGVTRENDLEWTEVVRWVTAGLMIAERYGITKNNVEATASDVTGLPLEAQHLLGAIPADASSSGAFLGFELELGFMVKVIKEVGNFGEIYNAHIENSIPRVDSQNALWTEGGLLFPDRWIGSTESVSTDGDSSSNSLPYLDPFWGANGAGAVSPGGLGVVITCTTAAIVLLVLPTCLQL